MNSDLLKTVGQVAGLGGLSLGLLIVIFREIIRKNVFPRLTKKQGYNLLLFLSVLTWSIAVAGLCAWVYTERLAAIPAQPTSHLEIRNATSRRGVGIFLPGNPFPIGFEKVKIGDKLSVAKAIMETGEIRSGGMMVDIARGPFAKVVYYYGEAEDPVIEFISFWSRDAESAKTIKAAAAAAFQGFEVESIALGNNFIWPDINGYRVSWRDGDYVIHRRIP